MSQSVGAAGKLYFVTIEVLSGNEGLDLPKFLTKIDGLLQDYSTATHVIYKFKVTGESKVIAVVQVNNVLGFERTIGGLWRFGNISVSSVPIVSYENFAQNLGVDLSLISSPPRPLPKENLYYWSFDLGYSGKTADEFLSTWKREAEFIMAARSNDAFPVELFKVVSERKVHCFLQVADPAQLDQLSFRLPLMRENGHNVKLECRAIQYLGDYCTRIFSEPL
ncbi:uncharacterized protein LOC143296129 [Babylonia areolata]|uniref:uncharacterized protein LOC143296129 n=1 Tax=Babylonia areolata TaxID=304850 RepID=UPI003FD4CA7A